MSATQGVYKKSRIARFFLKSSQRKYASLARLFLRMFPGAAVPVRLPFGAWWLAGHGVLDECLMENSFEVAELKFVKRLLKPGMTVLDVGAHHGLYSLLAAKQVGKNGHVRSFEPSPRERKHLLRNLWINGCHNVTVEDFALGKEAGRSELFLAAGSEDGCNSFKPAVGVETGERLTVDVRTLDEYLREKDIEKVDFIKLDVEGAELEVLAGARGLLKATRPVILAEVQDVRTQPWGYRAQDILRLLEGENYKWFEIGQTGELSPLNTDVASYNGNFVACPEERSGVLENADGRDTITITGNSQ